MKKLLLHTCCAPCCAYSFKYLQSEGYDVSLYFYNPNIHPIEEYSKRLEELKRFVEQEKISLFVEEPDFENWFQITKGHENDKERGNRCKICYQMRLEKTAKFAKDNGFELFTTSLSISPHKSYEMISEISFDLEKKYNIKYLDVNLKKKDGYKKSVELSNKYGFYRQTYCGCKYSLNKIST